MSEISGCLHDHSKDVNQMDIENIVHCSQEALSSPNLSGLECGPVMFEELCFVELSKSTWYPAPENIEKQTYLRGCKWSPDGTCCLTVVNNGGVHLLELPRDLYGAEIVCGDRSVDILDSTLKIPECGLVYDFCWFPGMNSTNPETCCWLTTRQHSPIQLWDAYDGMLRCSYRGYNAADEMESAISLCFSGDGTQIHGGYKKTLKTFDVNRPGREYVNQPINSSASCLCVSPTNGSVTAVGSWTKEISLYDVHQGSAKSIAKLRFHSGGVTHLAFLPDGEKLISGSRKDCDLLIWDIRFYRRPYKLLKREVNTNQRIYFDVSRCGKYLVSGGTDGIVTAWDLTKDVSDENGETSYYKTLYPLHGDCCNGVSIHPYKPILVTSSGQHHIHSDKDVNDSCEDIFTKSNTEMDCDVKENDSVLINNENNSKKLCVESSKKSVENSLVFWWTGKVQNTY